MMKEKMGKEIKNDKMNQSHRLGAPKNMVKAKQSLYSLQDISLDVKFSKQNI